MDLACWQVVSIPDGQVTAVRRIGDVHLYPDPVAGKWIISQQPLSILVFQMSTLQHWHTIDLRQVCSQIPDMDLQPARSKRGRLIRANGTRMAVEVEGISSQGALFFEICTGQFQGCCHIESSRGLDNLTWVAREPRPFLVIEHSRTHVPHSPWDPKRSELLATCLRMDRREPLPLAWSHIDAWHTTSRLIWPAPGGLLVLGLQWGPWEDGCLPWLLVKVLTSGETLFQCPIEDRDGEFRFSCECSGLRLLLPAQYSPGKSVCTLLDCMSAA